MSKQLTRTQFEKLMEQVRDQAEAGEPAEWFIEKICEGIDEALKEAEEERRAAPSNKHWREREDDLEAEYLFLKKVVRKLESWRAGKTNSLKIT